VNRSLTSLALLVSSAVALPSLAAADASVSLAYEAPEGCPTQPDFVAAVAARGGAFDGQGATGVTGSHRVMVVAIRRDNHGVTGAFQVREAETATNKREVHGQSCGEVVDALAVVTAIALRADADADAAGVVAPAAVVAPPVAPPVATPSPPKGPAEPPPADRLRGSTRIFPPRTEKVEVGAGTIRFELQRNYTLSAGVVVGMIHSLVIPRYDLTFVVAPFVTTPEGAQRIPGLVFQLRLSALGPSTYRSLDTTTDVSGFSFGIGLCQSPRYDTRGLMLLFCGEYGGGLMGLETKGVGGSQIQSKNAGYGTINVGGEIQYSLGSIFHVGAKIGGSLNVGDVTAEREDGSQIFKTSVLSAYGLLGIGLHF
jgi:hypothetical protein